MPRELSAQERAERAADLAPSADGPDVDLGALATMIARAEKCSPADGLRRAHQRYERLSIAARTGRDPGSRSSRGEPAPARSTKAVVGATQDPADVMGAAKMIQNRDGCDFAKAMSKAHREFPGLSEQARTQGVPFVGR
ncbi:MAG: hypothetical protein JNL50_13595 [Phycisphaerae bacterium]|nr:hypothetical protein [Phycisphaerae bacterium]